MLSRFVKSKLMKANSLQERLIVFASNCVKLQPLLHKNDAGQYYGKQLMRSSGSAALNYGESQSAESRRDFGHKLSICLKEMRESHNNLKVIHLSELCNNQSLIEQYLQECNELVAMLVTAVKKVHPN
jgi:four helix bundle protein